MAKIKRIVYLCPAKQTGMNQGFTLTSSTTFFSLAEIFAFSAKERDAETGLRYFGARYYSSDLSLWLSVDPMSDKYPHQSNYVYCSNNSLKVIDPYGEDEWEVNKSGHFRHVEGSEGKPDKLFAVRGFGEKKFRKRTDVEGLDVDAELMKGLTAAEKNEEICFYQSDRNYDMEEMFNYLADNTNVEWALATIDYSIGTETTPKLGDYLMTNYSRTNCNTAVSLSIGYSNNGRLIRFKHSHSAYYSLSQLKDSGLSSRYVCF